ncbi:hypothetical protein [Zoogloea sp.]|uniref:hypothetical protein n=1 Tax=Zoogloea sp. TaxID=49181 RepID=UPI0025D0DEC1|nr:hypothetical protein [Zoogloea sp.]MCK6373561.1 hypothetical protein [Zoogloea sp.]MCK6393262.1 hypothetical protein [Zoogloea sp.]
MEALHEAIEIILLLASVIGAVAAYFRFRGHRFGLSDMLIFVPLAVAADVVCYQLFQEMAGPHGESTAYGALESGAASRAECDRQSTAQAFREGCYAKLGR